MSDKIAIMRDGKIEQYGDPKEIYDYPINKWIAQFIGDSNIFQAKIINQQKMLFLGKEINYWNEKYHFANDQEVDVLIRPEDIEIKKTSGMIEGVVTSVTYEGSYYMMKVETSNGSFWVESTNEFQENEKVFLDWETDSMHLMHQEKIKNEQTENELDHTDLTERIAQVNLNVKQD